MIGLFRTLIVFGIILLIFRFITRYLLPFFVINERMQQSSHYHDKQPRREGEVTIKQSSPGRKQVKKDEGEYVDFEEIKD